MPASLCKNIATIIARACGKQYNGLFHVTINEYGSAIISYSESVPERTLSDFISSIAPCVTSMVFQRTNLIN